MKINDLEAAVINQQLSNIGLLSSFDKIAKVTVTDRWFSGVGFITCLEKDSVLKVGKLGEFYFCGEVGAKLNSEIDTGYLFSIEEGFIISIEGYTFGEFWPDKIFSIETYKSDLG